MHEHYSYNIRKRSTWVSANKAYRFDAICVHDLAFFERKPVRLKSFMGIYRKRENHFNEYLLILLTPCIVPSELHREAWVHWPY